MIVCQLTNIPAPYRERTHELIADALEKRGGKYYVVYSNVTEPNRKWKFELGNYKHFFLKGKVFSFKGRYIHVNTGVWSLLNEIAPDVLVIGGFGPTAIKVFLWGLIKRKKIILLSDSNLHHESILGGAHKLIRKIFYKRVHACIGAGLGTKEMFKYYGIKDEQIFLSRLCIENSRFFRKDFHQRQFHIMFSGQLIPLKSPMFFVEVAKKLKREIDDLKVLIIGSGKQEQEMMALLNQYGIDYHYPGFVDQERLPEYYSNSKLFLFPTSRDAWGLVANEACASGTPVIVSPFAGVANDLIINNSNGKIVPLEADKWVETCLFFLKNEEEWTKMSQNGLLRIKEFTPEMASKEFLKCVDYVEKS